MAEMCPYCGAKLPAIRDAFCSECHNDLDEAPARPLAQTKPKKAQGKAETPEVTVWFATEARVFRWMKLSWYDDRGSISITTEGLRFTGLKGAFLVPRISEVQLIGLVVPWAAVASLAIGNILVLLMARAGAFNYLTLENPMTYIVLALLNLFALFSWPMNWVRVDYLREHAQSCRAYFTASSRISRWTSGAERLRILIQQSGHMAYQGGERH